MLDGRLDPALVTSLGGEDRTGNGNVGGVGDVLSGTEVGRGTDVLDDRGEGDESRRGGQAKVVLARLGGSVSEGTGEERDVVTLVGGDLLNAVADPVGEALTHELLLGELAEGLLVEGVLEVLEGHCEVSSGLSRGCETHRHTGGCQCR